MKIGVLIPSISLGGAGRVALNQVKYFNKNGHKAKLLTLTPLKLEEVECENIGLNKTLPIMKTSIPVLVNIMWGMSIKNVDVDLIVAHGISSILSLRIKRKYGVRYVNYIHHPNSFLHGEPIHEHEEHNILGPLSIYPFKLLWNKRKLAEKDIESIKNADHNFVNSKRTLDFMFKIYGNIKASVCYPAINDDFHKFTPKLEDKGNYVLYASRHVEQKGFHMLPEILSKINNRAKLIIAGKPTNLTKKVLDEFRRLNLNDRVILKVNVSDQELIKLYGQCKVLIFPAIKEDFGLSPLEGMATGCIPVIWNDGGGIEEIIQNHKEFLLAKPYDIDDYASKVNTLLTDDENYRDILNEAKNISRNFSWDLHIKEVIGKISGEV
ncbi:TPA: glycosyltransferase [Candidatus Poribacteria bacterium]|nr:glycosyltransferase [Candidatus Poribacteria bacterium]